MGKWIFFIGFFITALNSQAAGNDTIQYPELNKTYIKSYWYDTKSFVVSPAKWKAKQWIEVGVIAGLEVLAYTQDEEIQKYFIEHQSTAADNFSKYVFEPFGRLAPVLIGGLYLGGRLAKDNRLAGTSLTAAKAFIVSAVGAGIIKQITHRHRPRNIPLIAPFFRPLDTRHFSVPAMPTQPRLAFKNDWSVVIHASHPSYPSDSGALKPVTSRSCL